MKDAGNTCTLASYLPEEVLHLTMIRGSFQQVYAVIHDICIVCTPRVEVSMTEYGVQTRSRIVSMDTYSRTMPITGISCAGHRHCEGERNLVGMYIARLVQGRSLVSICMSSRKVAVDLYLHNVNLEIKTNVPFCGDLLLHVTLEVSINI